MPPTLGFRHQAEAGPLLEDLRERLKKLGLELHAYKTRRIDLGRFAERRRARRGEGKPPTVDFLRFKDISARTRTGNFTVTRRTTGKRSRANLQESSTLDSLGAFRERVTRLWRRRLGCSSYSL